jgi:hypothetical protein
VPVSRLCAIHCIYLLIAISPGELADVDAVGKFSYEHFFSDTNVEQIESLPPTAWHRNVDLEIVKADNEGL